MLSMIVGLRKKFHFLWAAAFKQGIIQNQYICTIFTGKRLDGSFDDTRSHDRRKTHPVNLGHFHKTINGIWNLLIILVYLCYTFKHSMDLRLWLFLVNSIIPNQMVSCYSIAKFYWIFKVHTHLCMREVWVYNSRNSRTARWLRNKWAVKPCAKMQGAGLETWKILKNIFWFSLWERFITPQEVRTVFCGESLFVF